MLTFTGISQQQVDNLVAQLRAHQTTVTSAGDNFTIDGHGVHSTAVYDPQAQTLTVTVVHKPFFVSESMIQTGIQDALKA